MRAGRLFYDKLIYMREYVTQAFVLDSEPSGEYNARVFLFTKELGRITARARSLRKMGSKLAGHLQPLMISTVRLVEKNGFQVVDALRVDHPERSEGSNKKRDFIAVARLIREMTSENQPEPELWSLLQDGDILSKRFLKVMGFDPDHAVCHNCESRDSISFNLKDTLYFCKNCARYSASTI